MPKINAAGQPSDELADENTGVTNAVGEQFVINEPQADDSEQPEEPRPVDEPAAPKKSAPAKAKADDSK